jgi:hypothetical protein
VLALISGSGRDVHASSVAAVLLSSCCTAVQALGGPIKGTDGGLKYLFKSVSLVWFMISVFSGSSEAPQQQTCSSWDCSVCYLRLLHTFYPLVAGSWWHVGLGFSSFTRRACCVQLGT